MYVVGYVYQECKGYRVLAARPPALLLLWRLSFFFSRLVKQSWEALWYKVPEESWFALDTMMQFGSLICKNKIMFNK